MLKDPDAEQDVAIVKLLFPKSKAKNYEMQTIQIVRQEE